MTGHDPGISGHVRPESLVTFLRNTHYVELNASKGRSDDFGSALIQQSRSDSRGVVWYHFVTRDWGFKLSASESTDSSGYGGKARDLGLGLTRRW